MFKPKNLLFKAILFTLPLILCLWMKPTYGEVKREIEIKIVRQDIHEIISEAKVNHRSQFLLTTVSDGVMITAPQYSPEVIDDMVILMEGLGLYGSELLPEGHPAAIPHNLREYAKNKFTQSLDNLNKLGNYPELYLLSGIKFTNLDGKSEQFFVETSVLAGGTSLFMAHYSGPNIKLMGNLLRAIGWQQVALFPVNQHPRIPADLSNEFLTMCEENAISVQGSNSLRTILVSPDYLSLQGI
jgi:hypothetical protein